MVMVTSPHLLCVVGHVADGADPTIMSESELIAWAENLYQTRE